MRWASVCRAAALCIAGMAWLAGCAGHQKPTRLPIEVSTEFDDDKDGYINSHVKNPELFARERELLTRREELLINWATRSAMKSSNTKVRAIAPPLQLTGDD